jgi:hypothetical protein
VKSWCVCERIAPVLLTAALIAAMVTESVYENSARYFGIGCSFETARDRTYI